MATKFQPKRQILNNTVYSTTKEVWKGYSFKSRDWLVMPAAGIASEEWQHTSAKHICALAFSPLKQSKHHYKPKIRTTLLLFEMAS